MSQVSGTIQAGPSDQRRAPRTFEYKTRNRGRRRARRTQVFDEVYWHREGDIKFRRGILVGVSGTGLVFVTEHHHAIRAGMQIRPSAKHAHRRWRNPVTVTRVERLSDMLDLVAARYSERQPATD